LESIDSKAVGLETTSGLLGSRNARYGPQGPLNQEQRMKSVRPLRTNATKVTEIFNKGHRPESRAGVKLSKTELRQAVAAALKDNVFDDEEKRAFSLAWATAFTGADYLATEPAKKYMAELTKMYNLPVVNVD
jgi:hypothetical protein